MKALLLALVVVFSARADLVEFENGDRLTGKVLTLSESELKLQNDVQGVITLPRAKILRITFGDKTPKTSPSPAAATANPADILKKLQASDDNSPAIEQVKNQFLADASPEAQKMFQEMVTGLMSGKLQLSDIRNQAESTLKELKDLEKELGDEEISGLLGTYSAILENFIKQTPPGPAKAAPPAAEPAPAPKPEEEN